MQKAFRKGQWVRLTRDIEIGDDLEPRGTVGIHTETRDVKGGLLITVHLVEHPSGITRKICGIATGDLEPVTDREELPADRLATYLPDWTPNA